MSEYPKMIERQTHVAGEHRINGWLIKTQSERVTFHGPFGTAVWQRPQAILLEEAEQQKRIPITDITRLIQLGLWVLSTTFVLVSLIMPIYNKRNRHGRSS